MDPYSNPSPQEFYVSPHFHNGGVNSYPTPQPNGGELSSRNESTVENIYTNGGISPQQLYNQTYHQQIIPEPPQR